VSRGLPAPAQTRGEEIGCGEILREGGTSGHRSRSGMTTQLFGDRGRRAYGGEGKKKYISGS